MERQRPRPAQDRARQRVRGREHRRVVAQVALLFESCSPRHPNRSPSGRGRSRRGRTRDRRCSSRRRRTSSWCSTASSSPTPRAYRVLETSHPPNYYFPPDDVLPGVLERARAARSASGRAAADYFTACSRTYCYRGGRGLRHTERGVRAPCATTSCSTRGAWTCALSTTSWSSRSRVASMEAGSRRPSSDRSRAAPVPVAVTLPLHEHLGQVRVRCDTEPRDVRRRGAT